jgi:VWFA-related protein
MEAMRTDSPRTLLFILYFVLLVLPCLPAFSQDVEVIHVGVAMLKTGQPGVSDAEIRDHLVKVLNRHKAGKNSKVALQAVALDALPGNAALDEAGRKNCEFVLYLRLANLGNSSVVDPNNFYSGIPVVKTEATVEYLLKRISDSAYAKGTVVGESQSVGDAILRAAENVNAAVAANLNDVGSLQASNEGNASAEKPANTKLNTQIFASANACDWLPANLAHAEALRGVCEFAITLPQKIPNFVCEQDTSRYRGAGRVPVDLITATVRYEDGSESYSEIKRNGWSAPDAISNVAGLWSTGVFEGNLRNIFDPRNKPKFAFVREDNAGGHAAWVFSYEIAEQKDPVWKLRGGEQIISPPYQGEVWIDQKTGAVLRFWSTAANIPATFPMESAEVSTEYNNVEFGDGTAFVLPIASTTQTKYREQDATRNVVQFRGCHKFRAKTRLLLGAASGTANGESVGAISGDELKEELEQNQTIYEILRAEAIRQDEALLAFEQKLDSDAITIMAMRRLAALERQRQQIIATEQVASAKSAQAGVGAQLPTIKISVNLVPVSVVTRDGNGRAVGTLIKDDFRLFDERKPQIISRFSMEKTGEPNQDLPKPAMAQGSPAGVAPDTGESKKEVVNNVAYVFDDLHATLDDFAHVRDAAGRHLAELRAEDRAAIFTTSGEIDLDFTADREKLQAALKELKAHPMGGWSCPPMGYYEADQIVNHADADASGVAVQDAMQCTYASIPAIAARTAESRALEVALAGRLDSERALKILNAVIGRTAATTGRRTIVLVSPGFLTVDPGAQDRAMALIARAVQADIVVNTLDVEGVQGTGVDVAHGGDSMGRMELDRQEQTARSELMADLAYGTGGTFFHNNNDMNEGFRRTAETPEFIYVLGFSPQKLDGKFHKLKVALNTQQKLTVQARPGYYAVRGESQ